MTTHDFLSCPHKAVYPEFAAEQVNAFNNFHRPRNDPYSNFYNPGWRDHPNLMWDRDEHANPQFQQQVQQPAAPKATWEIAIEKLAITTNARFEQTNQEIQNLHATMKNMEQQIGQIAFQVSERAPNTFPSQTVPNPRGREECNAIRTLRSGKSYDSRHENCAGNSQPQDISKNTAEATTKTAERVYVPPMPYPERLRPKAKDQQLTNFMKTLAKVHINLPLIDAIKNIPSYAKFLKDVCTKKKKLLDSKKVILTEQCSAVLLHKLPPKKKDPGSFTISCTIGNCDFSSALIDLGASVNLMPYYVFKRLGEGELKLTSSIIQLADRSITYPRGVIEDVIVKVDNLYLPADFMVLDMDEDLTTPIILGRPFLATAQTLIDVEVGTLTFRVEDQTVVFRLFEATTHPCDKQECMRVDALDGLPRAKFVTRSSIDNLPIKTQNVIRECDSKAQQHKVQLLEVQKSKTDPSNQMDQKHQNVKSKNKKLHGSPSYQKIQPGNKVWLLSSNFKSIPGRQESRWKGPYMVKQVFHNGNVDIEKEGKGCVLKVKKYLLKPCIGKFGTSESLTLKEPVLKVKKYLPPRCTYLGPEGLSYFVQRVYVFTSFFPRLYHGSAYPYTQRTNMSTCRT
ncbi:uncharacterized protein LOC103956534 [Pyrus x bretschneideri]|uniref:uncharacterized protein LOC103956534 n=1 Tax=Pyrus x bretschneideri TaxID=225117 RepID=UPI00202DFF3C|nr:uncharacterized protein LOC103956534 [Pyrus x bretschneideri]